jgi:hypothetical protein
MSRSERTDKYRLDPMAQENACYSTESRTGLRTYYALGFALHVAWSTELQLYYYITILLQNYKSGSMCIAL